MTVDIPPDRCSTGVMIVRVEFPLKVDTVDFSDREVVIANLAETEAVSLFLAQAARLAMNVIVPGATLEIIETDQL